MRKMFLAIAIALIVSSCAKQASEEKEQKQTPQIMLSASFSAPDTTTATSSIKSKAIATNSIKSKATATSSIATRATATAFEAGDQLGLFVVKAGQGVQSADNLVDNARMVVAADGVIKGDPKAIYYPNVKSSIYSYYPHNQSGDATADALGVQVGIRTDQTDFSSAKLSDLCFGSLLNTDPSKSAKAITFSHKFSQIRVDVSAYTGCPAVKQVRLLGIKDSALLNIETGVVTLKNHTAEVLPNKIAENSYLAIVPAQTLTGACVAIDLADGKTFVFNAITSINLTQSATNSLNLSINDKGVVTLKGDPSISPWGSKSISSPDLSQVTANTFTFYWSPAITDFNKANKAFITLTNISTSTTRRYEVTGFVIDPLSTKDNAVYRFTLSSADHVSIGYPTTIDKFELLDGSSPIHTLTDYYGRTLTKSGSHTFGTVTSIKLNPATDWVNVANTEQSRSVSVTTTGNTAWVVDYSPKNAGLTVVKNDDQTATIKWAAQIVGAVARNGVVTFTTIPDGVSSVIATNQVAGAAPTLTLSATAPGETVPAGGKAYTINVVSNTAWTASALTNVTLSKSTGAAGTTAVTVTVGATTTATTRAASVKFTTNAVPSGATASQTWAGTQAAAVIVLNPAGNWTNVANSAQNRAIVVTTAGSNSWSAAATGTGLSVSPASGTTGQTATIAWAAQAVGATARSGSVKFSSGAATPITITTDQLAGAAPTLTLSATAPTDSPVPAGGKAYTINVVSNTAWTASALTNVTLSKSSGAAGTTAVTVTVGATTTASTRAVSVKFTTNAVPSGVTATQTWSGTQAAAVIVLNPAGNWANVAYSAQSRAIVVTTAGSNSWSAAATGTGLSVSPTSGTSGQTATIAWAAQAAGATARSGSVEFTSGVATPITVTTNQVAGAAPTLTLSATAPGVTVPKGGASYYVNVTSNTAWSATGSYTSISPSSGTGSVNSVKITVSSTSSSSTRSVSAVFKTNTAPSGATASQTWSGTQESAAPANSVYIDGTWWSLSNVSNSANWATALTLCKSPWRLPSKTDFQNLINSGKMSQVTGISSGYYWSSTVHSTNYAYILNNGLLSYGGKDRNYTVRCCQ